MQMTRVPLAMKLGAAVGATVLGLLVLRYEAVSNDRGFIFMHDRLFGQHRFCYPEASEFVCRPVDASPRAAEATNGAAGPFDDLIPARPGS